jgi:hypothetical protein
MYLYTDSSTFSHLSITGVSRFNALLFKVIRELAMRVLWLIYLALVMLAVEWLADEFIAVRNARFTSVSTVVVNFQPFKIQ